MRILTIQEEYKQLKDELARFDHRGDYVGLAKRMDRFLTLTGELYGTDSAEYATTLNDYGGIHRDIGNYELAEQSFLKAADRICRLQGDQHPDYASVLNNLAGLYRLMRQYSQSERFFQRALEIYEKTLGPHHFLYVSGLNNLGLLYQEQGRFADAEELHRRSLAQLEDMDNPIAMGTTLTNLASALRQQQRFDGVEDMLQRAIGIYAEELGTGHSLYAYGLNNLASYYMDVRDYSRAVEYYRRTLEICERQFGPESRNYSISRNNYDIARKKLEEQRGLR